MYCLFKNVLEHFSLTEALGCSRMNMDSCGRSLNVKQRPKVTMKEWALVEGWYPRHPKLWTPFLLSLKNLQFQEGRLENLGLLCLI
jgi:hypothetical protein